MLLAKINQEIICCNSLCALFVAAALSWKRKQVLSPNCKRHNSVVSEALTPTDGTRKTKGRRRGSSFGPVTKCHRWFNDYFSFSCYLYGRIINWHAIFHPGGVGVLLYQQRAASPPLSNPPPPTYPNGVSPRLWLWAHIFFFNDTPLSIKVALMNASPDRLLLSLPFWFTWKTNLVERLI